MEFNEVIDLVLKYEDRLLKHYRENILNNFKKNSKGSKILSERQYFILYVIIHKNINTITGIAEYLSLSKANISILTTKLEEQGYLNRDKLQNKDSRVSTLIVSELGEKVFNEARKKMSDSVQSRIEQYKSSDIDILEVYINLKRVINIDQSIDSVEDILLLICMKLNNVFEEIYYKIIKNYDLNISVAEFKIIKTLALLEKANFELLTEVMTLSYSTLSLQVKSLEEKGFVAKEKSFEDGRVTFIILTEKGNEVYDIFNKYNHAIIIERLSHKSSNEINDLVNVFNSLFKIFELVHFDSKDEKNNN